MTMMTWVCVHEVRYIGGRPDYFYRKFSLPFAPQLGWLVHGTEDDRIIGAPEIIQVGFHIDMNCFIVEIGHEGTVDQDECDREEMTKYMLGYGWMFCPEGLSPWSDPLPDPAAQRGSTDADA